MSDDPYVELARALDENGDPGVDLLTGLYPSVAAVVAERDRLRAAVDGLTETVTRDLHVLLRISTVVGERELAPDEVAVGVNFDELPEQVQALVAERDRLRAGLDTILNGLVGLDSDDAYVAITMEHLNTLRALLRKGGT